MEKFPLYLNRIVKLQNLISRMLVPPIQKQSFADAVKFGRVTQYYKKAPVLESLFNKL